MRPQFHFTRVSPGFSLKSTPLGFTPVEQRFDNCDERQRAASFSFSVIELRFLC